MSKKSFLLVAVITIMVISSAQVMAEKNPNTAQAYYMEKAPQIDANLAEWSLINPSIIIGPGSNVMRGDLQSAKDLTAKLYIGWDYEKLYIAIDVKDDSALGTFDISNSWSQDRINLCFDVKNDTTEKTYQSDNPGRTNWTDDDYWVYFRPFGGDDEQGVVTIMNNKYWGNVTDAKIAAVRTDEGYICEVEIPIIALPELFADKGRIIGFDVFITDGDIDEFNKLIISEIMWGRFEYPGTSIKWQYWKVGALEFAK